MKKSTNMLEYKFERTIPALPEDVFEGWLNPKVAGNLWNFAEKLIFDPKVDGFYYVMADNTPHYGRFTKMERPKRIEHTWVSPATLGQESTVSVTFKKQEKGTLMTLTHSELPDNEGGRKHEAGWNYFLNIFPEQFKNGSSKSK